MLDISSGHVPELLIVSSSSTNEPRQTFPKLPELAIAVASSGAPAVPDTSIIRGPVGSLLKIVMFADLKPKLVGWNRIGTSSEAPGAMVSGYDKTLGRRKSPEEDVMSLMVTRLKPLLLRTSISSLNAPTHTFPKLPESAITVASLIDV